jgi:thioredoxin reductase
MIWDVVVIGGGPAGLSAALNLARARRSVLVLDSNRPRNSATFASHGYLGHDGISPLQLRSLGREELSAYPDARFSKTVVSRVESTADGFVVTDKKVQSLARTVLLATGLLETFPLCRACARSMARASTVASPATRTSMRTSRLL